MGRSGGAEPADRTRNTAPRGGLRRRFTRFSPSFDGDGRVVAVEMVGKCNGHAAAGMECARTRPADRLASASVWSRFTFDWVAPLVNLGNARVLEDIDLPEAPTTESSKGLHDHLERARLRAGAATGAR